MCGITGAFAFTEAGRSCFERTRSSVNGLAKRGPDGNGIYTHGNVSLGHARLSIIDTSQAAAQPFTDHTGRYTIIFNGEFFNYPEHRKALEEKGVRFRSASDTEVLLYLFIHEGEKCLEKINGFFALAIYDKEEQSLFIARDRFGIKPLLYCRDNDKLVFASEMKSLLAYGIEKKIDKTSLYTYLQLNYIPAPHSIFENVRKLEPGTFLTIKDDEVKQARYYSIPREERKGSPAQFEKELFRLLDDAVKLRLVADVPLGAFLSGGIDSSVITALAARHTKHLKTFSIGYKDEPMFDETHYAELVAKKHNTDHTVFSLSNDDLFANLHDMLDYIDEPFADSSALAVHILSMHTRKHVTVALSGDGADELFGGYNKHMAEYRVQNAGFAENIVKWGGPFWNLLPASRNSRLGNKARQLQKFSAGMRMDAASRYWQWAALATEDEASFVYPQAKEALTEYAKRKKELLKHIDKADMNNVLYTDVQLVLPNDMLTKVDLMSMANSLEVRVPFLDYRVVNFAFSLPVQSKIDRHSRKKILKDAFRDLLPSELYTRGKQGFEVPLLSWFRTGLRSMIDELLDAKFIRAQGLFDPNAIDELKAKLFSPAPGDAVARVWALIVFQHWWKKYML